MTDNPIAESVEVTDVDSAAAALEARYAAKDEAESTSPEVTESIDETEEVAEIEATDEEEVEAQSEDQEPESEESEPQFSTLEELAEATGMEIDEFLSTIKGKVKIDGEEAEITLAEMREGQQRDADYRRKTMQLAEERKAVEQAQVEATDRVNAELQKTGQVLAMAQQQLTNEFQGINWNELQANNPTEYMLKRQQLGERQAQINLAIEQGTQQAQALAEQQKQKQTEANQSYLQEQDSLLIEKLPTWTDTKVRTEETAKLSEYMTGLGYQPDEIGSITDHRLILMARDAMQSKKTATKVELAKKQVKKVPKLVKPNARQSVNPSQQRIQKLRNKLKKTGDMDALSELLIAQGN